MVEALNLPPLCKLSNHTVALGCICWGFLLTALVFDGRGVGRTVSLDAVI